MKTSIFQALALALFSFTMLGATCHIQPPPVPIEPGDTADCSAACEKLQELGCPEGQPLEDGTDCKTFCKTTQKSGHALRPSCVMNITECSQVRACTKDPRKIFE